LLIYEIKPLLSERVSIKFGSKMNSQPLPLPSNEIARLDALNQYQILDTAPEKAFDDFTFLAAQICGTPIALISFIDKNRQWFKSNLG